MSIKDKAYEMAGELAWKLALQDYQLRDLQSCKAPQATIDNAEKKRNETRDEFDRCMRAIKGEQATEFAGDQILRDSLGMCSVPECPNKRENGLDICADCAKIFD